jgi:hypothetical protein
MSTERSGKSLATAWTLAILAVPVLYLLSVPPLVFGSAKARWRVRSWALMDAYAAPSNWLYDHTPMKKPLGAYTKWWHDLIRPP